jgi:hypothetical protein
MGEKGKRGKGWVTYPAMENPVFLSSCAAKDLIYPINARFFAPLRMTRKISLYATLWINNGIICREIRKAPNKHDLFGTKEEIFWRSALFVRRKKAKENVWPWMGMSALYVAAKLEKQKRVRAALFIRNRNCRLNMIRSRRIR